LAQISHWSEIRDFASLRSLWLYSGLHFNLALVEAALFQGGAGTIIVQPRVLARTEIVRRANVPQAASIHERLELENPAELKRLIAPATEFLHQYRGTPAPLPECA